MLHGDAQLRCGLLPGQSPNPCLQAAVTGRAARRWQCQAYGTGRQGDIELPG